MVCAPVMTRDWVVTVIPLVMIQIEMSFFLRFGFLFRVEFVFGSYKVMILKFSAA
jgi:hypothetical protein